MTDQQKVDWLATEVMTWTRQDVMLPVWWMKDGQTVADFRTWDPLTDWNNTMQVVERMESLGWQFWLTSFHSDTSEMKLTKAMFAHGEYGIEQSAESLQKIDAICKAAYLAYQSLR